MSAPPLKRNPVVHIRPATEADGARIARLAQLDSAAAPVAPALLAEVDGELVAAIGIGDGSSVADPFRPTADVVALLELRATQLGLVSPRARRRRGLAVAVPALARTR